MSAASQVIAALVAAPRHVNPAVAMLLELQHKGQLVAEELLAMSSDIEKAMIDGADERDQVVGALEKLVRSKPIPADSVPVGF